jgi:hypothetical protein
MASLPVAARATSTLIVDDDHQQCPNAGYTSLTAAVQASQSHDTIKICPGTYPVGPSTPTTVPAAGLQGLVIDKTLTILGAGASKVTIEPTQALASASASDNVRDKLGNVVTVQNTSPGSTSDQDVNPTISGVRITDGGFLVDAGIAFNNAAGTVTNSTIGPFTGSPSPNAGWGVIASNNEAVTPFGAFVRDVSVTGNLITGYGAGGVLIDGSESTQRMYFRSGIATTGTVTGNVITGAADATLPGQVGVQLNAGGRGTIGGNQITGNLGVTAGTASTPGSGVGILLTDADVTSTVPGSTTNFYTSIGSNNINNNGYGIFNGTADFPGGPSPGAPCPCSIYVNGTGFTPTSAQLPASLTNTAMSNSTATVTVN